MFRNNGFFILALRSMLIVSFVLSLFSFSPLVLSEALARELAPISLIGEVIADPKADAFILAPAGERLKVDSTPMPVLKESRVQTGEGVAIITLSPDGLVEVLNDSEIVIDRFGEKNFISIDKGAIRFTVPSTDELTVAIPSVGLSITPEFPMVSSLDKIADNAPERSGIVELMDDGRVLVSSSKGMLKVSSLDGNSMTVGEGKTFMLAKAGSTRAAGGRVAGAVSRAHNMLLLGATAAVATGVVLISGSNDSGGGWVASGP
ncbi:MAG: hypothetical protein V3V95_03715 [Thermodesulfobacteriota bacterium]